MKIMIRALALALSYAQLSVATKNGNLRTPPSDNNGVALPGDQGVRSLQAPGDLTFFHDLASYKAHVNSIARPTCPRLEEEFTFPGIILGQPSPNGGLNDVTYFAPNVAGLTWKRDASSSGFTTIIEDGVFKDRLDGDEMTTWNYPDMEAWGVMIDKNPNGLGSNLKINVMIGLNIVTELSIDVPSQFFGLVSPIPFSDVTFQSAEAPGNFETYNLDDMKIFPWCSPILGGLKGDPHIKTWSGEYYDYMGSCDLVMLRDEALDLELDARTTIRYGYSYVETAALRIGEDTLEVTSYGIHSLNDIDGVFFADGNEGATVGGYPIYYTRANEKTHNFDVVLGSHENITFTVYKDIVSVTAGGIKARALFENSKGLMGSMDGTLLGRDGVTEFDMSNADAFGQEWQVRDTEPMIFRTAREPQYPSKCVLPSATAKESRRLGEGSVTRTAAEMACARFDGAVFEACVYDVLAFEDLGYAESGVY